MFRVSGFEILVSSPTQIARLARLGFRFRVSFASADRSSCLCATSQYFVAIINTFAVQYKDTVAVDMRRVSSEQRPDQSSLPVLRA